MSAAWYPGDDVVDMIGYDKYNAVDGLPNLSSIASTFYSLVQSTGTKKMVAMTENDTIPSLENLVNDKAAWLYFCPWYKNYLTSEQNNPADNLNEIYTSDYCITLDELPDLKSYPISDEPQTTQPDTSENTSQPSSQTGVSLAGDSNCDGTINLADAIFIMQCKANPTKYTLSEQGEINSDVADKGDGVTNKDALMIQKYLLGLVDKL